jgi:hypothetical protein
VQANAAYEPELVRKAIQFDGRLSDIAPDMTATRQAQSIAREHARQSHAFKILFAWASHNPGISRRPG